MGSPGIPERIGTVPHFLNCTHINDQPIDYFAFALTRETLDHPQPPNEDVYYVLPDQKPMMEIVAVVAWAWKNKSRIQVFLQGNPDDMIVGSVKFLD